MVEYTRDGVVAGIELQRPDKRNALNTEICLAVLDHVQRASEDGVRVLVITGAGPVFCAGADLSGDRFAADFIPTHTRMLRAIVEAPMPVIAAMVGPAIGAGAQLALAADLRVMGPDSYVRIPSTRIGLPIDPWTVRRVSALAGGGVARGLLLGGERIGADQAYACGLANRIGDVDEARRWATSIAELAPLALRHLKAVLNDDGSEREQTARQQELAQAAWASEDLQEGHLAFRERRTPVFRGV